MPFPTLESKVRRRITIHMRYELEYRILPKVSNTVNFTYPLGPANTIGRGSDADFFLLALFWRYRTYEYPVPANSKSDIGQNLNGPPTGQFSAMVLYCCLDNLLLSTVYNDLWGQSTTKVIVDQSRGHLRSCIVSSQFGYTVLF